MCRSETSSPALRTLSVKERGSKVRVSLTSPIATDVVTLPLPAHWEDPR